MNALEARKHSLVSEELLGLDADAWFSVLDHRTVEVGGSSCIATVLGIHQGAAELWIQLSCADESDLTAVIVVDESTRLTDVLAMLRDEPPVGSPLEVIDCSHRARRAARQHLIRNVATRRAY